MDENVLELLEMMFNTYEPRDAVRNYAGADACAAASSLFVSIAEIFDGLAKDVDVMAGEVLFHEKLNKIAKQSRVAKKKRQRKAMTLYARTLGSADRAEAQRLWSEESGDVKSRFEKLAKKRNRQPRF